MICESSPIGGNPEACVKRSLFGAVAWILLATIPAYTATPEQLYRTWQKNSRDQPEIAEKAAADYLQAAPTGAHAHALQIWLDAYRKALAGFLARIPQPPKPGVRTTRQASAQPSPAHPAAVPHPPTQPPQTRLASAIAPNVKQAPVPPPPAKAPAPPPAPALTPTPPAPNTKQASTQSPPAKQAAPPPSAIQAPEPQQEIAPGDDASKKRAARQDSIPAAKPEGQSLDAALAFIAGKLDSEGPIKFTARFRNPAGDREIIQQLFYNASGVAIDTNRCRLSYRWHVEQDGKALPDQDRSVELRLAKDITVQTIDAALTELNSAAGHPFSVRAEPQVHAVHIARWDSRTGDNLYFRDSHTAERVGEIAKRAMELCDDKDQPAVRRR